jgi:integrase
MGKDAMRGNITRRGKASWRLKLDIGRDPSGKRLTRFVTVRGTKAKAQAELARLVAAFDDGTLVEPTKATVADYLRSWHDTAAALTLSPKTAERYRQLIERQIIPHLGAIPLQKLKPVHVANWHATLLKSGGHDGGSLSARTVGHAHRVLHKALADAARHELLTRNPASVVSPPKVTASEIETLDADQVQAVLAAMRSTVIYPQIVMLLSTGMRRGELAGLQWADIDLDAGKLHIRRAVEKTKAHGLRIKEPKTRHGRRTISLPASAVEVLKAHRKAQLELRVQLGLGKLPPDGFVFGTIKGTVRDPDRLTQDWKRFAAARGLPRVTLHALRHSHASALIASGADPVTVSRRLGHGSPVVTMAVYAHLFDRSDEAAAKAIDTLFKV